MNVDEGILFNSAQLPVTQLNYGGSLDRFSWVLYRLGFLRCSGKDDWAEYPSELIHNWVNRTETEIYKHEEAIVDLFIRTNELPYSAVYFTAHTDQSYTGHCEKYGYARMRICEIWRISYMDTVTDMQFFGPDTFGQIPVTGGNF